MSETRTPTLGLSLGTDADENRNWRILDQAIERIARSGTIVPNDLLVQGDLQVSGNTDIGGSLDVASHITTGILNVTDIHASNAIRANGQIEGNSGLLITDGFIVVPPNSIDGAAFWKNAPLQGVWISSPFTGNLLLPADAGNPAICTTLPLDAKEEGGRWELVIAQMTLRVSITADVPSGPTTVVTLALSRGTAPGTIQQTRNFVLQEYVRSLRDYPFTLVRWMQPVADASVKQWNLTAWINTTQVNVVMACVFAQLHVVQFR